MRRISCDGSSCIAQTHTHFPRKENVGSYSLVDHIQHVSVLVLNNCKNWLNVT